MQRTRMQGPGSPLTPIKPPKKRFQVVIADWKDTEGLLAEIAVVLRAEYGIELRTHEGDGGDDWWVTLAAKNTKVNQDDVTQWIRRHS